MKNDVFASAATESTRSRRSLRSRSLAAPLPAGFFARPAEQVARDLLGARIVSEIGGSRCVAEIVETEAYVGPHDAASHAHARIGRTERNSAMFGPPGIAYVYRAYGIHWCLNVVTGPTGYPAAVLLRAARPVEGIDAARSRRSGCRDRDLMRGPGNLARALGVDGSRNASPLDRQPLWLEPGAPVEDTATCSGPRIGVSRAADLPLRYWVRGNPWVSRSR